MDTIENRETQQQSTGQSCTACAVDTEGEECVICSAGSPTLIRAGFRTPPELSNNETRRMQHSAEPAVKFIFRCHSDLDLAAKRCPGGSFNSASCAAGYTGYTCGSCEGGFGMSRGGECLPCEENETSVGAVLLLIAVLVGIFAALALLTKVWVKFPWRHVVRCAAQPTRILITYSQITTRESTVARHSN